MIEEDPAAQAADETEARGGIARGAGVKSGEERRREAVSLERNRRMDGQAELRSGGRPREEMRPWARLSGGERRGERRGEERRGEERKGEEEAISEAPGEGKKGGGEGPFGGRRGGCQGRQAGWRDPGRNGSGGTRLRRQMQQLEPIEGQQLSR